MSRKPILKGISSIAPTPMPSAPSCPQVSTAPSVANNIAKWVPLICAGAAVSVSIFALKEIHNTRKEIMNIKKEGFGNNNNDLVTKKMESFEAQLDKITNFLQQHSRQGQYTDHRQSHRPKPKEEIHPVDVDPEPVNIINEEYEEVEVTDDEADD